MILFLRRIFLLFFGRLFFLIVFLVIFGCGIFFFFIRFGGCRLFFLILVLMILILVFAVSLILVRFFVVVVLTIIFVFIGRIIFTGVGIVFIAIFCRRIFILLFIVSYGVVVVFFAVLTSFFPDCGFRRFFFFFFTIAIGDFGILLLLFNNSIRSAFLCFGCKGLQIHVADNHCNGQQHDQRFLPSFTHGLGLLFDGIFFIGSAD